MLRSGISHYLPVVDTFIESHVSEERSEKVVIFFQVNASLVSADIQEALIPRVIDFPDKVGD